MISYILYRTASALSAVIPQGLAKRFALSIAFLFYIFRPRIRRNVRRNFESLGLSPRSTFPVFRNFSMTVSDFLRLSHLRGEDLAALCAARGTEHLDRALRAGRGAILFAPHLGPWEIGGAYLSSLGFRIHTVALEHPSARVTRIFSAARARWGVKDYPSHSCAPSLMKALARGEIVVLLIDRNFSRRGLRLRFLGSNVLLPDGHVILSLRSGAPLLPCCCFYAPSKKIEAVIGSPLDASGVESSPEAVGAACLARVEEFIRAHPEQWFAFDHLWQEG